MKHFFLSILACSIILNALVEVEVEVEEPSFSIITGNSGLEWQEESDGVFESKTWVNAIDYCNNLNLSDEGWRLPNFNELYSLVDVDRNSSMVRLLFLSDTNQTYWTSTTYAGDTTTKAWVIDFSTGKDGIVEKTANHMIRCVRDLTFSGGS